MSKNKKIAQTLSEEELECLVYQALIQSGQIPPQTPDEVDLAMAGYDENKIAIPPELADPESVLKGGLKPVMPKKPVLNPEIIRGLEGAAQAARKKGRMTPEIAARMKKDRTIAQRESGHGGK
jgi:hypothetical protein